MPKLIIDNFSGGISMKSRGIPINQFQEGESVDIYSEDGFIKPTRAISEIQTTAGGILRDIPINMVVDPKNNKAYILTGNGDLYQVTNLSTNAFNADFGGAGVYYKAITNYSSTNSDLNDLIIFNNKLCFSYNIAANAYVGTFDLTSTWDLTDMDLGNAVTNYKAPHPMIEWNGILWIGNGQYLAKSTDGATVTKDHFNLGEGWEITALFPTSNFIGICAWKSNNVANYTNSAECRIFFYDGTSSAYTYFISVGDNRVSGAINYGGKIFISSFGKHNNAETISLLTSEGLSPIHTLRPTISTVITEIGVIRFSRFSVFDGKLMICSQFENGTSTMAKVFSINTEPPYQLSYPLSVSLGASARICFAKPIRGDKMYIGWNTTAGIGTLSLYNLAGSSYNTANYRGGYIDFGQKVRINYVKFYFKALASGDSITVGIDTDYGTSNSLGVISYAVDGATTSKRFNIKKQCHSFRPTVEWVSGKALISKIVVEYEFTDDI